MVVADARDGDARGAQGDDRRGAPLISVPRCKASLACAVCDRTSGFGLMGDGALSRHTGAVNGTRRGSRANVRLWCRIIRS